jgi:very-short-patch-repair endonuclease
MMPNLTKMQCFKAIADALNYKVLISILLDVGVNEDEVNTWLNDKYYQDEPWEDFLGRIFKPRSVEEFVKFVELCLDPRALTVQEQKKLREKVESLLSEEGYGISTTEAGNGGVRCRVVKTGETVNVLRDNDTTKLNALFPFGLPVAIIKPAFSIRSSKTGQTFGFDENDEVGILRDDVYPNFCIADFEYWADPKKRLRKYSTPGFDSHIGPCPTLAIAYNLCQVDAERQFLKAYLSAFVLPSTALQQGKRFTLQKFKDRVPALIPQVWIQWTSHKSSDFSRIKYSDTQLLTRADFVAFWNNHRYIVLLDGIQHYAKQVNGRWEADEMAYASRVQEDRLLRTQGWHVFRVGNLEIRDAVRKTQVLQELREFIGFEQLRDEDRYEVAETLPTAKTALSETNVMAETAAFPRPVLATLQHASVRLQPGQKVRHLQFGEGIVVSTRAAGNDLEVTVAFPGKGVKRLLANFAKLEPVPDLSEDDLPF